MGRLKTSLLWILVVMVMAAMIVLVRRSQALPAGPRAVIWDRESCEQCRMVISDPRFAAQLQMADGAILDFDDPGCLITYAASHQIDLGSRQVHAVYFHSYRQDIWLALDRVAFVSAQSPMGHGLGAVDKDTPGAISYQIAAQRLAAEDLQKGNR